MSNLLNEQISNLLNKELTYLELYMKNGREIILHRPNKDDSNSSIELEEDYTVVKIKFDNGCINQNIIPYEAISYVNGMYNCPVLETSEE